MNPVLIPSDVILTKSKIPARLPKPRVPFFLTLALCCLAAWAHAQKKSSAGKDTFAKKSRVGKQKDGSYIVSTSQIIDPAGDHITFPGRPTDLALNSSETILAVKIFRTSY